MMQNGQTLATTKLRSPYIFYDAEDQIHNVSYVNHLFLCRAPNTFGDKDYFLVYDYEIHFKIGMRNHSITVPKNMYTDFASVPKFARWFVGKIGPHLEIAVVHDYMYMAWQDLGNYGAKPIDRLFADRLMLAGMKSAGVPNYKRQIIYWCLRLFGGLAYNSKEAYDRRFKDMSLNV